jgi:hypothetical protein
MAGRHEKKHPRMLPEPLGIYATNSTYPDLIRVSFSDGSTQIYEQRIQQPHPIIKKNLEVMRNTCIGYEFKGDKDHEGTV